jgi:prepilin-type N-terminal cleavage/methylation domain-containing protein
MAERKKDKRRGFTLVELLVVIAIIGVLVALLLPAVQAAREASRRMSCGSNIKGLITAIHTYHNSSKTTPINYGGNAQYNNTGTGKGWMIGILPFVEQQSLWDQIDWTKAIGDNATAANINVNTNVAATAIPVFLCPSDGANDKGKMSSRANVGGTYGVNNYKAVAGGNWQWGNNQLKTIFGPWPNSGDGLDRGNGFICRNSDNQAGNFHGLEAVTDGTSNTLAVGEAVPRWTTHTWWWWFNGGTATACIPPNYKTPAILAGTQTLEGNWGDWNNNYSFFSRHPQGLQFALVDGSVKWISNSVDINVYRAMASIQGGETMRVD